ncbi:MAG: hypothetical protein ACR2P7_10190, partial [bacterium]
MCDTPRVSRAQVAATLKAAYGLTGALTRLDGERDLNYRLDARDGRYVVKIAHRRERIELLAYQRAVFAHLAHESARDSAFAPAPVNVDALDGAPFAGVVAD